MPTAENYRARYASDAEFRAKEIKRSAAYKGKKRQARQQAKQDRAAAARLKRRAKEQARDRRVRQATPPWADMHAINAIYLRSTEMRADGWDVHVDHRIPLNGANVCGLHVPGNLRITYAQANLLKGNAFHG